MLRQQQEAQSQARAEDEKRTAIAREVAEAWRAADPSVRIVIGNTGESLVPLAKMFREKLPPGLIDAWAGQLFALEDENLREEIAADRVLVEDLVARYFHIG